MPSAESLAHHQRRAGLYLSCLAPALDALAARGQPQGQAARLGDAAINAANSTARHNRAMGALFTAMRAGTPAGNTVRLGDKGDGSAASREEARQRQSWLNRGHIPDVIRFGGRTDLFEVKCYTPFRASRGALGRGSAAHGGAASASDGHFIAFGNTEEHLITTVLGHAARGDGRALDRTTGVGRVDAKDGHYADALAKGHGVYLLVFESTGAMSAGVIRLLRSLAAAAKRPEVQDTTIYGAGRASPRTFYRHHLAAISSAIARADAQTVLRHATDLALRTVM